MSDTQTSQLPQLSAPWFSLQRQLTYTIGAFGGVAVSPLVPKGPDFTITITAMNSAMANGLVNILTLNYNFGPFVELIVVDNTGKRAVPYSGPITTEMLEGWLEAGLTGNSYYYGVRQFGHPGTPLSTYLIMAPQIIQYYNDNYSDPQAFVHYVAQDAFAGVLRTTYGSAGTLMFTTAAPVAGY